MMVARVAAGDTELGGCPIHTGDTVHLLLGSANTDEAAFPAPDDVAGAVKPTATTRSVAGSTAASGRTWPGSNYASRSASGTRRIPRYRIKPGVELDYTVGVRSVDSFPMVLGESL